METINIHELMLDSIRPSVKSMDTDIGGMKLIIIGKPGSGKSVLIKTILASKRHLIPAAIVFSGSEEANGFYKDLIPNVFIYNKFDVNVIKKIKDRQITAKNVLGSNKAWLLVVIDDCMDDTKIFNEPNVMNLFKNGRHWNVLVIIASQYVMDLKPVLRSALDGVFIFREHNINYKDKLWQNFASVVPTKKLFYKLMDDITHDYTALYIDNTMRNPADWSDCVKYFKAPYDSTNLDIPFGCGDYWHFHKTRSINCYIPDKAPYLAEIVPTKQHINEAQMQDEDEDEEDDVQSEANTIPPNIDQDEPNQDEPDQDEPEPVVKPNNEVWPTDFSTIYSLADKPNYTSTKQINNYGLTRDDEYDEFSEEEES